MTPTVQAGARGARTRQPSVTTDEPTWRHAVAHRLSPALLLRLEGLALLAVAVTLYGHLQVGWGLFAALILVPDVGLLGYLADTRTGAITYNLTHSLLPATGLGLVGLVTGATLPLAVALIWVAHIGADRAAGFGLKYADSFRDTHLQRVTREAAREGA